MSDFNLPSIEFIYGFYIHKWKNDLENWFKKEKFHNEYLINKAEILKYEINFSNFLLIRIMTNEPNLMTSNRFEIRI